MGTLNKGGDAMGELMRFSENGNTKVSAKNGNVGYIATAIVISHYYII